MDTCSVDRYFTDSLEGKWLYPFGYLRRKTVVDTRVLATFASILGGH
jgi:hypothetical protein